MDFSLPFVATLGLRFEICAVHWSVGAKNTASSLFHSFTSEVSNTPDIV